MLVELSAGSYEKRKFPPYPGVARSPRIITKSTLSHRANIWRVRYTDVGVIRSIFVISPDGTIEHTLYNVRAKGHVAKLRRDLDL